MTYLNDQEVGEGITSTSLKFYNTLMIVLLQAASSSSSTWLYLLQIEMQYLHNESWIEWWQPAPPMVKLLADK